jgi:hypothetical protein
MVDEDERVLRLQRLEPFVGEWRIEAPAFPMPPELADAARTTFEWTLGGAFLLQRSSLPVPGAPDDIAGRRRLGAGLRALVHRVG